MEAVTSVDQSVDKPEVEREDVLLDVQHLVQEFKLRGHGGLGSGVVHAVSDVSFTIRQGETVGLVGETGSGKSTLARAVMQAPPGKGGDVWFEGRKLTGLSGDELRDARSHMSMIYQDPFASLDPKWRVGELVEEPLRARRSGNRSEWAKRSSELLDLVGLDPKRFRSRRPRSLSGGQCQRVAIARALMVSPTLVICDEAVSSLDVLMQAQVLNLFEDLRSEFGLSYLFIGHDLATIRQVSDRVAVMYLGKLCEIGDAKALYQRPRHPYTMALMASVASGTSGSGVPEVGARIRGETPSPLNPPSGCRFRTRCPMAQKICAKEEPQMREVGPGQAVACHFPNDGSKDKIIVSKDNVGSKDNTVTTGGQAT